jgi:Rieske 2Fe-2S family protein
MDSASEQRILREMETARHAGRERSVAARGERRIASNEYGDAALFAAEIEGAFRRSWLPVARASELREPGQFVALDVAGEPVLIVAGADGTPRALSNVCRHRGSVIARGERGCVRELRCPFHGFTYDLDGKLSSAPAIETFDEAVRDEQLPRFELETWGGWLWTRLRGAGPTLEQFLGDALISELDEWELAQVELKQRWSAEGDFDWKIAVEAFLEPLHVASIHQRTVHPLVDYRATSFAELGVHSRQAVAFRVANAFTPDGPFGAGAARAGVESFPRLNRAQLTANFSYLIFPATVLNLLPNHFTLFRIEPLAPARTRLICELYARPASGDAAREFFTSLEAGYTQLFDEDLDNLAWIHKGCSSRMLSTLHLSDLEQRVEHFRATVGRARQLTRSDAS